MVYLYQKDSWHHLWQGKTQKNSGLVIYEGTEAVTDANVETARKTRNQYVWVPIDNFEKDFVRREISSVDPQKINELGQADKLWEVVLDANNMPKSFQDKNYVTATTLEEVQDMYESVKAYGGFYIARYEAGIDTQRKLDNGVLETNVYSMMGKIPYTYIPWTKNNKLGEDLGGAVEVARSVYPENSNYGVVSTLTYGVQWDTILAWWLESGAVSTLADGTSYGNHNNHIITSKDDLNDGAMVWDFTSNAEGDYVSKDSETLTYPKQVETYWALTTGALKQAKVNNIYDMSGNMWEWTMEGYSNVKRAYRGGSFHSSGTTVTYPVKIASDLNAGGVRKGLRIALYIKND